jgi:hypothetical protein
VIAQKDLNNLKEQLERMQRDKDRVRLVVAAAENFRFSTAQVLELVNMQHFGDARNQTAILTYPQLTDPEKFEAVVLASFKFEEDKTEIKDSLGL